MNNDRKIKTLLIFFILIDIYALLSDLFDLLRPARVENADISILLFSLFMCGLAGILIKHYYWVLAMLLKGVDLVAGYVVTEMRIEAGSELSPGAKAIIVGLIGIAGVLFSIYFLVKLFHVRDLASDKHIYRWFRRSRRKMQTGGRK